MLRLITIAAVCTMLLVPIAGYSSNIISSTPLLIAVSFGLAYLAIPAFLLRIWPAGTNSEVKSMQDALWDGDLVTHDFGVTSVAEIQETEDEGFHFLLATSDGSTLFLSGQDLYGAVERRTFPADNVRVFKNRITGVRYGVEPLGRPFEHWPLYTAFSGTPEGAPDQLEDGKLYEQSIPELVHQFCLKPVKREPERHDA